MVLFAIPILIGGYVARKTIKKVIKKIRN